MQYNGGVAIPLEQAKRPWVYSADAHLQRVVSLHDSHAAWLDEYDRVFPALREHGETLRAQAREMMLRPERRPMNLRDAGAPRLDLDGFRVKNPGQPQIYLVDMG